MKSSFIFKKTAVLPAWKYKNIPVLFILLCFFGALLCALPANALEITDDLGRVVTLERPAERIVSLYAGHTENLAAIGAADSIAAAGQGALGIGEDVPVLGSKPGLEQIIALSADVVLTRPMMERAAEPFYEALEGFGIKVVAIDPPGWDEFPAYIGLLAEISGAGNGASKIAADLMTAGTGGEESRRTRAFLVTNGATMATCTPDSWAAHIMELAGLENAAGGAVPLSEGSVVAAFGAERLVATDDEIDVILLQQGAMNTTRAYDFVRDMRFSSMRAVRNGMVFDVPEADISRPSLLRLRNGVAAELRALVTKREVSR